MILRPNLRPGRPAGGGLPRDEAPCWQFLVSAPIGGYRPGRAAEIRVPDEPLEESGPVVVYVREGRRCW